MRIKLTDTMRRLLTHANPRPKQPVLKIHAGSDLEEGFANLWRAHGAPIEPVREYPFARHLRRAWRFDFAWPEQLVAVELEGLLRGNGGRHQRAPGFIQDCEKYNTATLFGWRVLRFTSADLRLRPLQMIEMVAVLVRQENELPEGVER